MTSLDKIRKSNGPEWMGGPQRGYCHNGMYDYCDFWAGNGQWNSPIKDGPSRCLLFGGAEKHNSTALRCCDKIYGMNYEGEA